MLKKYFSQFIDCHHGIFNKILHLIGFGMIGAGIFNKNLSFVIAGALIQELGHFYQYSKTRKLKDSPWHCLRPQLLFAYPILALITLYVLIG